MKQVVYIYISNYARFTSWLSALRDKPVSYDDLYRDNLALWEITYYA